MSTETRPYVAIYAPITMSLAPEHAANLSTPHARANIVTDKHAEDHTHLHHPAGHNRCHMPLF